MANYIRVLILVSLLAVSEGDYWARRRKLIDKEEELAIGSQIVLNPKESALNNIIKELKQAELDEGFANPDAFAPAKNFMKVRDVIARSKVFKIIQSMPKGAALHAHDTSLVSIDYVVENFTYRSDLYACIEDGGSLQLRFFDKPPSACWKPIEEMRKSYSDFDAMLKSKMSLITDDPEGKYPDINTVWTAFTNIFGVITPLVTYVPVFRDYMYRMLQEFYDDNVMYVEMRTTLPDLYELNGTVLPPIEAVKILKETNDDFVRDHPDSLGMKIIYAPPRHVSDDEVFRYLEVYRTIKQAYPDFIAGFDLVGQEDLGYPLQDFIEQLQSIDATFFFHAGETNWNGMATDMNLVDAVLLNTTRIGHGFAAIKHPAVLEEIKRKDIAIEVNPISNQVLMLVKDLRNHPLSFLLSQNYPVVVSCDDPHFWGAAPLSSDFYEAFVGIASRSADLRMLKQLALNSIRYSVMNDKTAAFDLFNRKWDKFIDDSLHIWRTQSTIVITNHISQPSQ